jgi:hypothetical protein
MQIPKVSSSIVHKYLSDPRFKKEFKQSYTVDRSHDIPYVAGYSTDNKKVFVDRHFNKMMDGKDIEPYIFIHEKCEKALIDTFGLKYQVAHHIANYLEKATITKDGIDWNKYEKFVMNQYKHIGHEKLQKIPHDLDITPYKDEKDIHILKQMKDNAIIHNNKKS